MSLSENAIPQLVVQETDIPEGDNNYVEQVINQDIIIHVIEIPDLDSTAGIQNFIQTDRDIGNNNQVAQNINQTTVDFPLFSPNYAQSNSQAIDNNSLSLDFNEYINNDGALDAVQFTIQQAYVEGNDNILDFYSEQRIFDISGYDQDGLNPDYVFDETLETGSDPNNELVVWANLQGDANPLNDSANYGYDINFNKLYVYIPFYT